MANEKAKMEDEGQQTIELSTLSAQQLQLLRQQTEEELDFLMKSHNQLISALKRFKASATCLSALQPKNQDEEIFVPLTSSLYVKGRLSNVEKLMVDIGTGYYAEKDVAGAQAYFDRRSDFLQKNADGIAETLQMKKAAYALISEALQNKIAQMAAQKPS